MIDCRDEESTDECVVAAVGRHGESQGDRVTISGDGGWVFGLTGGNASPGGIVGESDCDGVAGEAECALSVFS